MLFRIYKDIFEPHQYIKRNKLFKKYVLELVNAAIPALRKNNDIMEGGCECTAGIDENMNPIDAILAIMSIAKYYYTDLQVIRQTADLSELDIEDGLTENIRIIFLGIRYLPVFISRIPTDVIRNKYLFKRGAYKTVESVMKCYQSITSIYSRENQRYFDQLALALHIVRLHINNDDQEFRNDSRSAELNAIIDDLYTVPLITAQVNFEQLRQSLELGSGA